MIVATAVVLLGFLIGLVSGSTGIGGGTLLAPFLMFVLKVDPFISVGTDLFVSVLTKAVGSVVHGRANNVQMNSALPMCVAGAVGALGGTLILAHLKSGHDPRSAQQLLRHIMGGTLCLCAIAIAAAPQVRGGHKRFDNNTSLGVVGAVVGALTAITGVGVGSLSVPALYFIKGRSAISALVGTSLLYATVVTAIGAAAHAALHDVNYGLAGLLLCGSIPGVILGSTLATRASSVLKPVVVLLLVISGARLIA